MSTRSLLLFGLVSGILAAIAGVAYFYIYQGLMLTEFDAVVNPMAIAMSCIIGTLLMALGYGLLNRFKKFKFVGWLNILIGLLSFLSIIPAIDAPLPLDMDAPELFPGLVIPMHFFPAIAFLSLVPFFVKTRQ